jgi:hypothetical protein
MAVGVRPPSLPLVYHAPLALRPPAPLPIRVVHSHRSLFMQASGIIRTGCTIYGSRGQTSPTTPGIPSPPALRLPGPLPVRVVHSRRSLFMQVSGIVRQTTLYMAVGVRHPLLPLVYHAPPFCRPLGLLPVHVVYSRLPVRVVHSRSSLSLWYVRAARYSCRYRASLRQTTPYMGVGVRPPSLPLVYHAPPLCASPPHSLFMQVPGIVKADHTIYGSRGQTSPTTPGIPCPRAAQQAGRASREPPRFLTAVFHRLLFH